MAQDKVDVTSLLRELRRNNRDVYERNPIPAVDKYAYTMKKETRNSLSLEDISKLRSVGDKWEETDDEGNVWIAEKIELFEVRDVSDIKRLLGGAR